MFQASVIKKYPAELIMVFYYCFFVAIQAVVVSLIVETDLSAWSLKPKMRLIAVVYSVNGKRNSTITYLLDSDMC